MLERLEPIEAKRSYTRIALQTCPWILREHSARAALVKQAYCFTLAAAAPIASAKAICREIKKAAVSVKLKKGFNTKLLLADIWEAITLSLTSDAEPKYPEAGYAAARAILYDPARVRRKELAWPVIRGAIGPRAILLLALLKRLRLARARFVSHPSGKALPIQKPLKRLFSGRGSNR